MRTESRRRRQPTTRLRQPKPLRCHEQPQQIRGHPGWPVHKRILDLVLAGTLLAFLSPGMLLVAVLIRCTSPGGSLFGQPRVGYREKPFVLYKFRTMRVGSPDAAHREYVERLLREDNPPATGRGVYKLTEDPRVTPIGSLLRRLSVGELPQLFNVLRGDMSLVGPRPVLPWEASLFEDKHRNRYLVPPGISGLWQISGRSRLTFRQALELDLEYVARRSLRLDLLILLKTIPAVLTGAAGGAR